MIGANNPNIEMQFAHDMAKSMQNMLSSVEANNA